MAHFPAFTEAARLRLARFGIDLEASYTEMILTLAPRTATENLARDPEPDHAVYGCRCDECQAIEARRAELSWLHRRRRNRTATRDPS